MNRKNEYRNCPSCEGKNTVVWNTFNNDDYPEDTEYEYYRGCTCPRCGMCDGYETHNGKDVIEQQLECI